MINIIKIIFIILISTQVYAEDNFAPCFKVLADTSLQNTKPRSVFKTLTESTSDNLNGLVIKITLDDDNDESCEWGMVKVEMIKNDESKGYAGLCIRKRLGTPNGNEDSQEFKLSVKNIQQNLQLFDQSKVKDISSPLWLNACYEVREINSQECTGVSLEVKEVYNYDDPTSTFPSAQNITVQSCIKNSI